jgi:hypothetical protein
MFDLAQIDTKKAAEEGRVLHLVHPKTRAPLFDGDGNPVTLSLLGKDSKRALRAESAALDRRLKAGARRGVISADDMRDDTLAVLIACTTGWSGLAVNGQDLPYSPENAKLLYEQWPDIREQANAFIEDRANFLKDSPQS